MAKIEQLFERFGEKADFATIYIAEAHAAEEWSLKHSSNAELDGKWDVAQPKTMDERMKVFTDWYEWLSPTSPHSSTPSPTKRASPSTRCPSGSTSSRTARSSTAATPARSGARHKQQE